MTTAIIILIIWVGAILGDRNDLRENGYHNCRWWWQYAVQYAANLFHSIDQLINSVVLMGHPNETISGRAGRLYDNAWYWWLAYYVIGLVFFPAKWDLKHCDRYLGS